MEASRQTAALPELARSNSPLILRVRHFIAAALVTGSWADSVVSLARIDPLAVNALADELQVRWS